MIQYHEGVPFCIMQPDEAGVNIDCERIVKFLELSFKVFWSALNKKSFVHYISL